MMRHPGLMSKNDEVKPILGEAVVARLQEEYLEVPISEKNLSFFCIKAIVSFSIF